MPNDESDDGNWRLREHEQVQSFLKPRIERAERAYSQALTGLWLGNAGAALATLSLIGVFAKASTLPKALLVPLGFFIAGLVSMGLGSLWTLTREKRAIEDMQGVDSILDVKITYVESPAERVGLSFRDGRTAMALVAGGCFIVGCVSGFVLLVLWAS